MYHLNEIQDFDRLKIFDVEFRLEIFKACADFEISGGFKIFSIDCNLGSEIRWIITMNVSLLSSVIPCIWVWFQVLSLKIIFNQFAPASSFSPASSFHEQAVFTSKQYSLASSFSLTSNFHKPAVFACKQFSLASSLQLISTSKKH